MPLTNHQMKFSGKINRQQKRDGDNEIDDDEWYIYGSYLYQVPVLLKYMAFACMHPRHRRGTCGVSDGTLSGAIVPARVVNRWRTRGVNVHHRMATAARRRRRPLGDIVYRTNGGAFAGCSVGHGVFVHRRAGARVVQAVGITLRFKIKSMCGGKEVNAT